MLDHRMVRGKAERPHDMRRLRFGLRALELDAGCGLAQFDAVEQPEEIEVPPGAAVFAIGRGLEPDRALLADDAFDFAIFDRLERARIDVRPARAPPSRVRVARLRRRLPT